MNAPPRGVTPLVRWLLMEVLRRPRPELRTTMDRLLDRLDELEGHLPWSGSAQVDEIAARFLEAGQCYRLALLGMSDYLKARHPGGWARAARHARRGAALLEQADALNYRLRETLSRGVGCRL
ncbi:MAG: hypothetical protein AB1758_00685 [Candidatus Eremiobacterota bacterium]